MLDLDSIPLLSYSEAARLLRLDGILVTRDQVATAAEILRMGAKTRPGKKPRPGHGKGKNLSRRDYDRLKDVFGHRKAEAV